MSTRTSTAASRSATRLWLLLGALVLGLVAVAFLTTGEEESAAAVTVTGDPLPAYDATASTDPAVGRLVPQINGSDLDGDPINLLTPQMPTVVVVVAHWCPHCQAEIPRLVEELRANGLPEGAEVVTVATSNLPTRPNYPAADWLDREGWFFDTLLDDDANTAGLALGVSSYPMTVWLDADHRVVLRTAGALPDGIFSDLLAEIATGEAM